MESSNNNTKSARLKYDINVKFSSVTPVAFNRQLKYLIQNKVRNKEFFYGIEVLAKNYDPNKILDYLSFGVVQPLFTSIVWLGSEYCTARNGEDIDSVKLACTLRPHVIVLPHFLCYHLNLTRLEEFLNLNFSNILAIRGDYSDQNQEYKYSIDLVTMIRRLKGDSITIGVAGYPAGHPESSSIESDLDNLFEKVQAGADFIITQICFCPQTVINFIKKCRHKMIKVPILVGIFIPDNLRMLQAILRITNVKMPPEMFQEYEKRYSLGLNNFRDYSIQKAVEMIETIFASDAEVYGLHFSTLNKFANIPRVLSKIDMNKN